MPLWVNMTIVAVMLGISLVTFDEKWAYAAVGWLFGYIIYLQIS